MRRYLKQQPILLGLLVLGISITPLAANDERASFPVGESARVDGIVTASGPGAFTLLNERGREVRVVYTDQTEFEEQKRNIFREPKQFSPDQVSVGLEVTVQGEGDGSGNLVAESVKFTQDALRIAQSIRTRVGPLESEVDSAQNRIVAVERNLDDTRAQIGADVSDLRAGIRAVGDKSGTALRRADEAFDSSSEAHDRLGDLDDYREFGVLSVPFDFNSSQLTDEARQQIDDLVADLLSESGYMLEVSGFASADGDPAYNRRLSETRANHVIRYLVEEHEVPRQRVLAPFGFGENKPVGDNSVLEGRQQNRRVEIRVLINMGIQPARKPAA